MANANQEELVGTPIEELAPGRLATGVGELAVFTSSPLEATPQDGTSEAVIVIHGALRNAGDYFRTIRAAEAGSGRRLIVAPQFLTDADVEGRPDRAGLLHWREEDWKGGLGEVSSFEVMDRLLAAVAQVPGLRRVTIVGNSAGGQLVNRYAAVGRGPDEIGVPVRFVISNPSTYLYFHRLRPSGGGFAEHPDPQVDRWRYGFGSGLPGYVRRSAEEYFAQYIARDVTYLLGSDDNDTGSVLLEIHPAATAQGRARRERGELYHRYLAHVAGRGVHKLVVVEGVGHDASAMYVSPEGRGCLFGDLRLGGAG